MPQIKVYEGGQVRASGPIEGRAARGEDFGAQIGEGASQLGQGLQSASDKLIKYQERSEISDLNAKLAESSAQWTQELQDRIRKAEPGDDTFVDTFKTDYSAAMDKLGEDYSTPAAQRHFQESRAKLTAHFMGTAIAGQAELTREKVLNDRVTLMNGLQNQLRQDPSAIDSVLSQYKDSQTSSIDAGIDRASLLKLEKTDIASLWHAKIVGDIERNPQKALLDLESGTYVDKVSEGQVETLIGHAHQYIHGQDAMREHQDRLNEKAKKKAEVKTQGDFLKKLQADELTADDVLKSGLAPFGSGSQEQFLNLIKNKGQEALKDNTKFIPLFQAVNKPDGAPGKITDERDLIGYVGSGLSYDGYNALLSAMQGAHTAEGKAEKQMKDTFLGNMKRMMSKSNDLLHIPDVTGDRNYEDFLTEFLPKYAKERSAGKTPYQLLNSKGEFYMGSEVAPKKGTDVIQSNINYSNGILKPYTGPLSTPNSVPPKVPPIIDKENQWKPGESAADVLKRVK